MCIVKNRQLLRKTLCSDRGKNADLHLKKKKQLGLFLHLVFRLSDTLPWSGQWIMAIFSLSIETIDFK